MRISSLWVERTAWVVGITLVGVYGGMRLWAEESRAQAVEEFHAMSVQVPDQSLWSQTRVAAYAEAQRAGDAPQGLLRIPRLTLEVPVYGDTSDFNLDRGAGHISGTAALAHTGNIGIAAHRDGFFRKLKDVQLGMDIFVESGGKTLRYRVVELRIVTPQEGEVLAPTDKPSVTLVTCYPFYFVGTAPQRFIVRGELDDTQTLNHVVIPKNLQRRET
jgi:sortase A